MTQQEIKERLARYEKGDATVEDIAFFESFYIQFNNQSFAVNDEEKLADVELAWQHIEKSIGMSKRQIWWPWLSAAALLLLISGVCLYIISSHRQRALPAQYANDVPPGAHRAILKLSNGRTIALDDQHKGFIAKDASATIRKNAAGEISYESPAAAQQIALNTMTTPMGGTYQLKLADGTTATLDAGSSITYPVTFTGKERKVEITGQVYFEVAHDARKPFLVTFKGNVVKVLGTHFNINSYTDEPELKTTLLQGSILLTTGKSQTLLKPGEQGVLNQGNGSVKVSAVNIRNEVSWTEDYFIFDKENIKEIMRQLSRWYGIEVVYTGPVTGEEFSGAISRNKNISQVLHMLEYSQAVHFKISGRRVIVMD